MFEAVVLACLETPGARCAPRLLPGYEATEIGQCEARLSAEPPDLEGFSSLALSGAPYCAPAGPQMAITRIAPGVFVHQGQVALARPENGGDIANIAIVIGTGSVAVIDSGSTRALGEQVWRAIRARTELPVGHVILTHLHPDHALGAAVLAETGAEVVAHAALSRALADRADRYLRIFSELIGPVAFMGSEFAPVTLPVSGTAQIDLGGRRLELKAWQRAHTSTDLSVIDSLSATLFAGDLLFDSHTPSLDGSLRGWQSVMAEMAELPVRTVVPGHGAARLDWPAGGAAQSRYLDRLAEDTRQALATGQRLGAAVEEIAQDEAGHWAMFDVFNPQNAIIAYTELEWE